MSMNHTESHIPAMFSPSLTVSALSIRTDAFNLETNSLSIDPSLSISVAFWLDFSHLRQFLTESCMSTDGPCNESTEQ